METTVEIIDGTGLRVATMPASLAMAAQAPGGEYPYGAGFRIAPVAAPSGVAATLPAAVGVQDGETISARSVARVEAHASVRDAIKGVAGAPLVWAKSAPVVPTGTTVTEDGVARFKRSAQEWNDQPPAGEAARRIASVIKAEDRVYYPVNVSNLRMTPEGGLTMRKEGGARSVIARHYAEDGASIDESIPSAGAPVRIERRAWGDIAGLARLPAPENIAAFEPGIRAALWNTLARVRTEDTARLMLRRPGAGEPRAIFGAVSLKYTVHDGAAVMSALADRLPGDVFGDGIYNPETGDWSLDLGWHAAEIKDLGAGDAYRVRLRVEGNDTGDGAIRGTIMIDRNLCRNFLILGSDKGLVFRVVHKGSVETMAARVAEGIEAAYEGAASYVDQFAEEWGIAATTPLRSMIPAAVIRAKSDLGLDAATIGLSAVADWLHSPRGGKVSGVERDKTVALLLANLQAEGDDPENLTAQAVVNAVTRMHERVPVLAVPSWEAAGGRLLSLVSSGGDLRA